MLRIHNIHVINYISNKIDRNAIFNSIGNFRFRYLHCLSFRFVNLLAKLAE